MNRTLGLIRDQGCKAGLVFNPATPLAYLDHVMDKVDLILIMSVNPGFGGQKFIPASLHKIEKLAALSKQSKNTFRIEVDGGIGLDTVASVVRAGAEVLVAGNAVFGSGDPKTNSQKLLKAACEATLQKV